MVNLFQINKLKIALLTTSLVISLEVNSFAESSFLHDPVHSGKRDHFYTHEKHKPLVHAKSLQAKTYSSAKADSHKVYIKKIELVGMESIPPADVQELLDPMIGSLASVSAIDALAQKITKHYQEHGRLLTLAYVPKQSFDKGLVKINVIEGSIRDVIVEGDIDSEIFKGYIAKILELNPVTKDKLVRYLQLINKIPGYEIKYAFEPVPMNKIDLGSGKIADLILVVERRYAKVTVNIDNYGSNDLGRDQGSLGGQMLSPFNKDESIIGFVGTTNKPDKLRVAVAGYKKIINSEGTAVQFLGSYATNVSNAVIAESQKNDISTMAKVSISHYPILSNKTSFKLEGGVQNNTQEVFNGAVKQSKYHILSAFISTEIQHRNALQGFSSFTPVIDKGIGGASNVTIYDSSLKKYSSNFTLVSGNFWHDQPLIGPMSLFFGANGQYSGAELPLERKFAVGGLFNGRGYKTALVSVNKGGGVTAELRFTKNIESKFLNTVQPYGFYDLTAFSKSQALTNVSSLSSAGAGLRFTFIKDINFNFEIGQPLKRNIIINGVETRNTTRYSFVLNKVFNW